MLKHGPGHALVYGPSCHAPENAGTLPFWPGSAQPRTRDLPAPVPGSMLGPGPQTPGEIPLSGAGAGAWHSLVPDSTGNGKLGFRGLALPGPDGHWHAVSLAVSGSAAIFRVKFFSEVERCPSHAGYHCSQGADTPAPVLVPAPDSPKSGTGPIPDSHPSRG